MIILRSRTRRALVAAALVSVSGCDRAEGELAVGEEPVEDAAAVDPALLAALPPGTSPETVARGRELFVVCSVCHGGDAAGTALGPSLRDTTWIHIDGSIAQIAEITRTGVEPPEEYPVPMPPMGGGGFGDSELQALATYVYALGRMPG